MRPAVRYAALATALACGYTWLRGEEPRHDVVEVATRPDGPRSPRTERSAQRQSWLIDREEWAEASADPFVRKQPPPPPVVAAPPPPPPPPPPRPVQPPLPYKYFGRFTGPDGKPAVFLSNADRLIQVGAADVLDGQYRVEAVGDRELVLMYLPLQEKTIIVLPSESQQ